MLSFCTCYATLSSNGKKTPAVSSVCLLISIIPQCAYHFNVLVSFSHQLCIFAPDVKLMFLFMLFYRPCTAVTTLFPQVEVGDIFRINGSDFVPADAVILSSRYRRPTCCQAVGKLLPLFFFSSFFSQLSLKR